MTHATTTIDSHTVAITGPAPEQLCRRLAACWNACEGLDTEGLENLVSIGESIASMNDLATTSQLKAIGEASRLLAQRDELLWALQSMVVAFHPPESELDGADDAYLLEWFPEWTRARAAIAKHQPTAAPAATGAEHE